MSTTKCNYDDEKNGRCNVRRALIIGDCKYCEQKFCCKHRLPESHACSTILTCQTERFERNKKTLLSNSCVGKKLDKT